MNMIVLKAFYLPVALPAIHRFVAGRPERNLGLCPALAAHCWKHFSLRAVRPGLVLPAGGTARRATGRLVREAFFSVELLFAGRENELVPAVTACQDFVRVGHKILPPLLRFFAY